METLRYVVEVVAFECYARGLLQTGSNWGRNGRQNRVKSSLTRESIVAVEWSGSTQSNESTTTSRAQSN